MKKLLPIMLVVAMALPALAAVEITAVGNGLDLEISINTTAGEVVRGLALVLDGDGDNAVSAVVNEAAFNAYIDYYFSNAGFLPGLGDPSDLPGVGAQPLADVAAAGEAALPTQDVSLSLGVLDEAGAQAGFSTGGTPVLLATVTYAGTSCITITEDALRGGIVGDNITTVTVPGSCVLVDNPECFNDNLGNYAAWVQVGKPDCWCYQRQCRGDYTGSAVGPFWVQSVDLGGLIGAYNKMDHLLPAGGECADFNHSKLGPFRVQSADLGILIQYYNKMAPLVPLCPLAGAGGEINFYTN